MEARRTGGAPRRAIALAALVLVPGASLYGSDLQVLLEAVAGVRSDGNYLQSEPLPSSDAAAQRQTLGRGGLNLDLDYRRPRLELALGYNPLYEESFRDKTLDGVTHRLRLGLLGNLSRRTTLAVDERLIASPNLELVAIAPTDAPQTIAVPRRGNELIQRADAGLTFEVTPHTSYFVTVDQTERTFSSAELSDSRTLGATAGVGFHPSERSEVQLLAGGSRYDFPGVRSADVGTAGLAYRREIGLDGHFRVEAGGFTVSTTDRAAGPGAVSDSTEPRRSGLRGSLAWSTVHTRWSWSAAYRHDVAPGVGLGRPILADDAFLGIGTLGRRVSVGLDLSGSRSHDLGPATDARPLTEFGAATARISWAFVNWARLDAGASRIYQRARVPGFDNLSYPRYFVGLAVRLYSRGVAVDFPPDQGGLLHARPDLG